MDAPIMTFDELEPGQIYKIVADFGYFSQICILKEYTTKFATFKNKEGKEYNIYQKDVWKRDNPVRIYQTEYKVKKRYQ